MSLVYACICPHGTEILPESGDTSNEVVKLRTAMDQLGREMKASSPDVTIIATPHGLRLEGYNAVVTAEYSSGKVDGPLGTVEAVFRCDRAIAREIVARTRKAGIPVVGCNYGGLSGPASNMQLDYGALVPLAFFGARDESRPDVVLVGPTRDIPLAQLVEFGRIIGAIAAQSPKRVAFVASADHAHTHTAQGPYGFDPAAERYDRMIVDIVREDRLEALMDFDLDFVAKAQPDSLWQMLILYGVSQVVPLRGRFLAYGLPSYFGMLCASYQPVSE
ncbi:MAG: extradiol ring-cleavage dioxygenase [Bacillota bacterium]|jgi:aromatic ring-opening dioxygenase LigB subunit